MTGLTIWLTGLSGAGKSTLANALHDEFQLQGHRVEVLDGDMVRQTLSKGLGFSREDRDENVRRIGYVARLLSRQGVIVIVAAMSPHRAIRDEVRDSHDAPFLEVFVDCAIDELVRRDTKGLYAKAFRQEISLSGVNETYEIPDHPDVTLHTHMERVGASVETILAAVEQKVGFKHRTARLFECAN